MLRIAICDDDLNFLDEFTQIITTSFASTKHQINLSTFTEGKSLIGKIEKEKQIFDIIFLDVEMPLINGFQVAKRLREFNPSFILIFTTYIEHKSREGYLYGAFRYVFKNNLVDEIKEAVASLIIKLDNLTEDNQYITLKYRNLGVIDSLTLRISEIIFLKAEKTRYITLKTIYSEYELLIKPLSEYAELLNSTIFVPIMRNYLLNFNHVESIDGNYFVLTGGLKVPLGIKREVRKSSMEKYLRFLEERI